MRSDFLIPKFERKQLTPQESNTCSLKVKATLVALSKGWLWLDECKINDDVALILCRNDERDKTTG